jgi:uncharacterized protein
MTNYFIVPGLAGSGANHWQTWFEESQPNFQRIEQNDWHNPDLNQWVANIDKSIASYNPESVVLVAHSLGCLAVAAWANRYNTEIRAALLVAPPDVELLHEKLQRKLFEKIPLKRLNFKSILIASGDDPWASIKQAEFYAKRWGSELMNIGNAGHINDVSGHYQWREGLEILYSL